MLLFILILCSRKHGKFFEFARDFVRTNRTFSAARGSFNALPKVAGHATTCAFLSMIILWQN